MILYVPLSWSFTFHSRGPLCSTNCSSFHSFIHETYIAHLQVITTQRRSQPSHGQRRTSGRCKIWNEWMNELKIWMNEWSSFDTLYRLYRVDVKLLLRVWCHVDFSIKSTRSRHLWCLTFHRTSSLFLLEKVCGIFNKLSSIDLILGTTHYNTYILYMHTHHIPYKSRCRWLSKPNRKAIRHVI